MSYKWWLFTAISLFAIGLVFGLATSERISGLLAEERTNLEKLANILTSLPEPSLFALNFAKNVSAVLLSIVLSPILFLVPVLALLLNGWLLGIVSIMVIQEKSVGFLLAGLLPHGIFELTALFIGEAVALSFGAAVILALWKGKGVNLRQNLRQSLRFLALAFALFLLAAVIETYLTPLFLRWAT